MSRLNIEDRLYIDFRFIELIKKTGSEEFALGAFIRALRVAKQFWCPEMKTIPKSEWTKQKISDALIECGLARVEEAGVYVCGTRDACEYYFKTLKQRSAAGKASGVARARKKELRERLAQVESNEIERNRTESNEAERGMNEPQTGTKRGDNVISFPSSVEERLNGALHAGDQLTWVVNADSDERKRTKLNETNFSVSVSNINNTYMADLSAEHVSQNGNGNKKQLAREADHEAFDLIFQSYPQRDGDQRKKKARDTFLKHFKSDDKRAELEQAVLNYRAFCEKRRIVCTSYVMQMATFINGPWEEYVSPAHELSENQYIVVGSNNDQISEQIESHINAVNQKGENT